MSNGRQILIVMLSVAILSFGYGFLAASRDIFPSGAIRNAHFAWSDLRQHWRSTMRREPTRWLRPARKPGTGVIVRLAGHQPGLTLISSFFEGEPGLRLIAADGRVVAHWPARFLDYWSRDEAMAQFNVRPATNWEMGLMGAVIDPDGTVTFTFNSGGLVRLDRCRRLIWKQALRTHHAIVRAEDGTLWAPGVKRILKAGDAERVAGLFRPPLIEDSILHLSADGKVIKERSIAELFRESGVLALLVANGRRDPDNGGEDYFHLNDVDPLPAGLAGKFPGLVAGDVLISLRHMNLIAVVDSQLTRVKWHQIGPWIRQHDPDFDASGRILVFNNNTHPGNELVKSGSSILAIDPATRRVDSVYTGRPDEPFYTDVEGMVTRLANGNLLISEAMAGRILEVDRGGRIVWEYINRYDAHRVVAETNAYGRYPVDYFSVKDWSCNAVSALQ